MADNFLHFLLETSSMICSDISLPAITVAVGANWHTATNLFEKQREANFRYKLIGCCYKLFPTAVPLKWISHIF
jgi:hypothetical protein